MYEISLTKKHWFRSLSVASVGWIVFWICTIEYGIHDLVELRVGMPLILFFSMIFFGVIVNQAYLTILKKHRNDTLSYDEKENGFGKAFRAGSFAMIICIGGLFFTTSKLLFFIALIGSFLETSGIFMVYNNLKEI